MKKKIKNLHAMRGLMQEIGEQWMRKEEFEKAKVFVDSNDKMYYILKSFLFDCKMYNYIFVENTADGTVIEILKLAPRGYHIQFWTTDMKHWVSGFYPKRNSELYDFIFHFTSEDYKSELKKSLL